MPFCTMGTLTFATLSFFFYVNTSDLEQYVYTKVLLLKNKMWVPSPPLHAGLYASKH